MKKWAQIINGQVTNTVVQLTQPEVGGNWVDVTGSNVGVGHIDLGGGVYGPPAVDDPTQWLIDVGPFMDRFGLAKLAVLSSTNTTVKALITDLMSRKWIDLQRPDLAAGIDLIIAAGVAGVDGALKTSILTTPVQPIENLALRRLYFRS